MNTRPFGRTGLRVSPVTFGAWSIGGPAQIDGIQVGWPGVDDQQALEALKVAKDLGINCYDTADSYAHGHSEELIGRAFDGCREEVVISSKAGIRGAAGGGFVVDFSEDYLTRCCEASLRRLRTDYLDIYLLHAVNDKYVWTEETRRCLEQLKRSGKIRHYGVSVQVQAQAERMMDEGFGECMMIEVNPLNHAALRPTLERAEALGLGVMTRGALAKGLLTGKYAPGHRFAPDDVRSRMPAELIDRITGRVRDLAARDGGGLNLVGLALRFALAQPGCSTVTVGIKTAEQARDNVRALEAVNSEDWRLLASAFEGV